MNPEQVEEFTRLFDEVNHDETDERSVLRLPARQGNEGVAAYRERTKDRLLARSQALRDDEADLFGDALNLVATGDGSPSTGE